MGEEVGSCVPAPGWVPPQMTDFGGAFTCRAQGVWDAEEGGYLYMYAVGVL